MVEQYTIPRIGSIKLTKLTAHDLQKLYKDLMENGRIDRKSGHGNPGLSSTTCLLYTSRTRLCGCIPVMGTLMIIYWKAMITTSLSTVSGRKKFKR